MMTSTATDDRVSSPAGNAAKITNDDGSSIRTATTCNESSSHSSHSNEMNLSPRRRVSNSSGLLLERAASQEKFREGRWAETLHDFRSTTPNRGVPAALQDLGGFKLGYYEDDARPSDLGYGAHCGRPRTDSDGDDLGYYSDSAPIKKQEGIRRRCSVTKFSPQIQAAQSLLEPEDQSDYDDFSDDESCFF
ncbi:hypothetical protein SEMRO_112_G055590.1 [Seminavis robusta]|uniref:Uncharacterized protein n=1 Tax=Seminavis robusta TaxID=568900 RepID=A0A9N8H4E4_9STRA|nr:hypothetical protein SEMRO_112_G055590.1 [Seminavis robusta]|eukprot:Sro112_g055590.1 n/a (191) ;mRNA; f:38220-38792